MLLCEIDASATLILHMQRYDNPASKKYNGDCCDIFCGSCDPSFRFALDRGNRFSFIVLFAVNCSLWKLTCFMRKVLTLVSQHKFVQYYCIVTHSPTFSHWLINYWPDPNRGNEFFSVTGQRQFETGYRSTFPDYWHIFKRFYVGKLKYAYCCQFVSSFRFGS